MRSRVAAKPSTSASATTRGVGRCAELAERDRGGAQLLPGHRRCAGPGREQVGLVEREPVEQDRAVLEHRAVPADLRRAAELASPTRRSAPCWPAKHTGPAGPSWRAIAASTPRRARPAISAPASRRVDGVDPAGRARRPGQGDRVRDVGAVEEPHAAGRAAHHLHAVALAGVGVDVVVGLEAPERQRRRRPTGTAAAPAARRPATDSSRASSAAICRGGVETPESRSSTRRQARFEDSRRGPCQASSTSAPVRGGVEQAVDLGGVGHLDARRSSRRRTDRR